MKNFNLVQSLGGKGNLIAGAFGSWDSKVISLHLYQIHRVNFTSLVKSGYSVSLNPASRVILVAGSYQQWKEAKQVIKGVFNPGR